MQLSLNLDSHEADTEIVTVVENDRIKVEISDFEEIQTQLHLSLVDDLIRWYTIGLRRIWLCSVRRDPILYGRVEVVHVLVILFSFRNTLVSCKRLKELR